MTTQLVFQANLNDWEGAPGELGSDNVDGIPYGHVNMSDQAYFP